MNTQPNTPPDISDRPSSARQRRQRRTVAAVTGVVLVGAGIFAASTASAADSSTPPAVSRVAAASPASSSTASPSTPTHPAPKLDGRNHAKQQFARLLRLELRTSLQAKAGFGDKAHEIAYLLIHHGAAFGKLPATLQTDLKVLEAAPAATRDAGAARIKDTALDGGYGDKIQKVAKNIQARLAKTAAAAAS